MKRLALPLVFFACNLKLSGMRCAKPDGDTTASLLLQHLQSRSNSRLSPLPSPWQVVRKTRYQMHKAIDPDYYGFRDEDDGVMVAVEAEAEKLMRAQVRWGLKVWAARCGSSMERSERSMAEAVFVWGRQMLES